MPLKMSWKKLSKALESYGWFTERFEKNLIIFEKGRQRIVVRRHSSTNKWKIEYYSGRVMDDAVGFQDEYFTKATVAEMSILK